MMSVHGPLAIHTGPEGGEYSNFGNRLKEESLRLGLTLDVRSTNGTVDNVDRMESPTSTPTLTIAPISSVASILVGGMREDKKRVYQESQIGIYII
jgi:hypothetical protein